MSSRARSRSRSRSRPRVESDTTNEEPPRRAGNLRWLRWRSWRTIRSQATNNDDGHEAEQQETWVVTLDRLCQQVAPYLPTISSSTKKAIFWIVALLVAWKVIIWALEMVVTAVCFVVALLIVACFLKPDAALVFLTQVLPPYIEASRTWMSRVFLRAGRSLTRVSIDHTPALAVEAAPPSTTPQTPRSPRTLRSTVQVTVPAIPAVPAVLGLSTSEPALIETAA